MSKLPNEHQFYDLSDYGRPAAKKIARSLKNTAVTPVHMTLCFLVAGLLAIFCILKGYNWAAVFFLVLKSILDAADGELSRVKNIPSYTGRYLDSIFDIILNLGICITIGYLTDSSPLLVIGAFLGIQLQGTLYNYYYVILRNRYHGDTTSQIFENKVPMAKKGEKQDHVNILFNIYRLFYGIFDRTIYFLDRNAPEGQTLPNWLMTAVSTFGLGFQLLFIGIMLVVGLQDFILPSFAGYTIFILVFIGIRKFINR